MKNVLQDQSYLMHVKSNLYDKFKEIYSQKREAVVKFHAFVAPLTIFGAIWNERNEILKLFNFFQKKRDFFEF